MRKRTGDGDGARLLALKKRGTLGIPTFGRYSYGLSDHGAEFGGVLFFAFGGGAIFRDCGAVWAGGFGACGVAGRTWRFAGAFERLEGELALRYSAQTVNAMLAAVNCFCKFAGTPFRLRFLKVQRAAFRDAARDLTRADYERLLAAARSSGRERLGLVMETLCGTGIRVSELRYITVDAARRGRADIALKGKIRTILIPRKLAKKLLAYAKCESISSGEVFRTRTGRGLSRRQVWYELKRLCRAAGSRRAGCSRTISGTCLRRRSTARRGILRNWRTSSATVPSTPRASTSSPPAKSTSGSWSGWGWCHRAQKNRAKARCDKIYILLTGCAARAPEKYIIRQVQPNTTHKLP